MNADQEELDLDLWLNQSLAQRQNQLKNQFIQLLEAVGNSISNEELITFFEKSKGKKISKGNDLLGFPYQVLDLIRDFDKESGMNIRLLNWFGNGFFVLIFLGSKISVKSDLLSNHGFQLGLVDDPWDFGALILEKKVSNSPILPLRQNDSFEIWIKELSIESKAELTSKILTVELKKILELELNYIV
jgi:hypothetical protein